MRAPHHLNALRAFEAAGRHLSYVAAADELNVTPAAVGQLVRALEEAIGAELFHRSPAGPVRLVLTDQARAALPDIQAGFDRLAAGFDRLKAAQKRTALHVTLPVAFADKWLLPRLDAFGAKYPAFDLRVDTSGRLVDFVADRFDVGIRYGGGHWPGLVATFLLRDAFFPVCAPELVRNGPPLRSPEDLRHHALIHDVSMPSDSNFPTWRAWLQHAGYPHVDSAQGLQINDPCGAIRAAIAGSGVALGRTTLVAQDLAEGRLVRPFGDDLSYDSAYYIVHRPLADETPGVAAFKTWLLEAASR